MLIILLIVFYFKHNWFDGVSLFSVPMHCFSLKMTYFTALGVVHNIYLIVAEEFCRSLKEQSKRTKDRRDSNPQPLVLKSIAPVLQHTIVDEIYVYDTYMYVYILI